MPNEPSPGGGTAARPPPDASDADLVQAAVADPVAFDALYRRYLPSVYRFALAQLGSAAEAEDVTASVFLAALAGLAGYRERGRFPAWLFTIARREVWAHRRGVAREVVGETDVEAAAVDIGVDDRILLARALAQLTPDRREAIALRFYGGLPVADIARITGRGESAVKMLLHRGLAQLRQLLVEELDA